MQGSHVILLFFDSGVVKDRKCIITCMPLNDNRCNKKQMDVVENIIRLNTWLAEFWGNSHGWVPDEAAILMSKSRLDRQVSLSKCLVLWLSVEHSEKGDGHLILAWANLGSLIEGTLKLFLVAYYKDYKKDIEAFKDNKGKLIDPDGLALEKLRTFFKKKNLWSSDWNDYTNKVQQYRNAIHAFKDRDIGTFQEYEESLNKYLEMIRKFNLNLPYPDEVYVPE